MSPGKMITGVQVLDERTGRPIGFGASIKRNWVVLVPIMPLVIAVQLLKGRRAGDGMAHTRVIWKKYAGNPVFTLDEWQPASVTGITANVSDVGVGTNNPYEAPRF